VTADPRESQSVDTAQRTDDQVTRRRFLEVGGVAAGGALMATATTLAGRDLPRRPQVAAIFTVFQHRSHAHVILENFLETYLFNGQRTDPGVDVVSFYADQTCVRRIWNSPTNRLTSRPCERRARLGRSLRKTSRSLVALIH